jgi:hypothetical protein
LKLAWLSALKVTTAFSFFLLFLFFVAVRFMLLNL